MDQAEGNVVVVGGASIRRQKDVLNCNCEMQASGGGAAGPPPQDSGVPGAKICLS